MALARKGLTLEEFLALPEEKPALEYADDVLVPPDLAIEIISPGETLREMEAKCRWYVENGVRAALLVNHRDDSIRVFWPGIATETWRSRGRIDLCDVVPGLAIVVEDAFGALNLD
ncbi:MAG TPA: Uma2 family endonuclease [Chloroflexota bacterium]|nr:Uma2 family endonuclease [Chloroflexota bacterium]